MIKRKEGRDDDLVTKKNVKVKKSKDTKDGDERREESIVEDGTCWVLMAVELTTNVDDIFIVDLSTFIASHSPITTMLTQLCDIEFHIVKDNTLIVTQEVLACFNLINFKGDVWS